MKRFPVAYLLFSLLMTGIAFIILHYAVSQYLLKQTKKDVQSILLSHRGFHLYIQQDLHPTFFAGIAEGGIDPEFYDPRILSSSYITRVMHGYFNEERKKQGLPEVYYKMAANNPRNPVNKADAAESRLIREFNANRDLREYEEVMTVEGKKILYYAIPFLQNEERCLRCHGRLEDAPPGLRERYPADGGFYEQLGEIRAIESLRIPLAEETFAAIKISIALATVFFVLVLLFLFNSRLRQRVRAKTARLEGEIEERQKLGAELATAHQQMLAILSSLDALVYVADMETYELLFVNAYGRKIFGDIEGKICWQTLQSGQDGPCPFCTNDRLLDQNGRPNGVYVWKFQNTVSKAWFDCRDQAIPWSDSRLVRMEIATDITERKVTEDRALSLGRIVENSLNEVYIFDRETSLFLFVNRGGRENLGYEMDELSGLTQLDIKPEYTHDSFMELIRPLLNDEIGILKFVTRHKRQDGTLYPAEVHLQLSTYEGKQVFVAIILDITERLQAEEALLRHRDKLEELVKERTRVLEEKTGELEKTQNALQYLLEDVNAAKKELEIANVKLKELDKLKSMFIASMSHELRTPLNSIIGFSGLILGNMTGPINDEQRDMLSRVSRAGKHLLSLITDVIDIAKIESGKIVPYPEEFLLAELIDEACESMKVQISDKGLELVKVVPETAINMKTDRRRLLQCLLNFLSNAVKFSEKGKVCVEVVETGGTEAEGTKAQREREEHVPEGWVEISVSDTGIGIREENMELLFGSFVRLDSPLKVLTQGTGLGLYLTKKLATEVLGGEVGAKSEEGKGSIFFLRIPMVLEDKG